MTQPSLLAILVAATLFLVPVRADQPADPDPGSPDGGAVTLRIATYNISLYDQTAGKVQQRLRGGDDAHARSVAAVIQSVRPDVLLINEIDHNAGGETANLFADQYLAKPQHGHLSIDYPHRYAAPSNTGINTELDLDGDGKLGEPADAMGFGIYPGQYAFAIFSRYPIDESRIRTFQKFLWKDFPGAKQPVDPGSGKPYYSRQAWDTLRLSSKNHVDVPVQVGGRALHVLASHPTPPVFDGPEDRNGKRNRDEVAFWNAYISQPESDWLVDDQGRFGGLAADASFVIAGDLNSDRHRGESIQTAIGCLLDHPRVQDPVPRWSSDQSRRATADFGDDRYLRVDYVLPSADLAVRGAAVVWPGPADADWQWIQASDHRMVWVEVRLP